MRDPNESLHKIEDIKRHLYDRDYSSVTGHKEGYLHPVRHEVPDAWAESSSGAPADTSKPRASTLLKNFFMLAIIFLIGAIVFGVVMLSKGPDVVSSDKIDITVLGNAFTEGGEELPLQIEIVNNNSAKLELASMVIEYPRGASSDMTTDMIRIPRDSIGTIEAGARIEKNTKVVLYGDQGSVKNITIKLEYHPEGSNATFTKEVLYPVTISSAPISLTMDGPTTTSANQEVAFSIKVSLNTTLPSTNALLKVDYPSGFIFESATPSPIKGKSIWALDTLTQATPLLITLKGRMMGQDGDEQALHVYVGTTNPSDASLVDVVYNSLLHTVSLQKPFLDAKFISRGEIAQVYAIANGKQMDMEVAWANNLPTKLSDVELRVHLDGNVFDKTAVSSPTGFYDSLSGDIIWNKSTYPAFATVPPGGKGSMVFNFTPIATFGGAGAIVSPQVALTVSLKGRDASQGSGFIEAKNLNETIVKIFSDFQIATNARYASGAFPPKAETETAYNITWTLSNSTNQISNAEVRTVLPLYIKWGGVVGSTAENISYNDVTREVIWRVGTARVNTGFGTSNRELSFKLLLKPSLSQVGSIPQLTKETVLTGTDSFTTKDIKTTRPGLSTRIEGDPNFKSGFERVIK